MTFFQRRSIVSWSLINIIIIFVIIVFIKFCKIYGNETKWTGTVVPVFRIIIWPCVYLRVSSIIFSHYPNYDLNGRYFLSSSFMILETNMLGYIYTFFFILFQQLLHTSSLERSLFFMYYLLDGRQLKAFMCNTHVFNLQRFERERVYTGNELFDKLCTSLPSIFMTGVHPPSPQPKFPMWQKTDNGWESTRRVTTPLTLDLSNQNKKKIQLIVKTMMVK